MFMCIPIKYCEHCKLFVYEKKSKSCMKKNPNFSGEAFACIVFVSRFDCFFNKKIKIKTQIPRGGLYRGR